MPRLGNARTISELEFIIGGPGPGSDAAVWTAHGAQCTRDIHRYTGAVYSYYFEIVRVLFAAPRQREWEAIIVKELWRFHQAKGESRLTKSLKLIRGRATDLQAWSRINRDRAIAKPRSNDEP